MNHIPSRRLNSPFMIGIFVLSGIVLLGGLTLWLGASKFFQEYAVYNTYFDTSVQGLEAGQPVKYQGVPIGNIQGLRVAADGKLIEVTLRMNKNVVVNDSMRLRIELASIAGSRYLLLFYPGDPVLMKIHPRINFATEHPVIPSAPSSIEELRVSLNEAINNILAIDTRGISAQSVRALRALAQTMENPEIAEILHNANISSRSISRFLGAADTANIVGNTSRAISDVQLVTKNLIAITETLLRTAEQVEKISQNVDTEVKNVKLAERVGDMVGRYDSVMTGVERSVSTLTKRTDNSILQLTLLLQELKSTNRDVRKSLRMISDNPSQLLFAEPPPKEK